jgi:hypothetical protein
MMNLSQLAHSKKYSLRKSGKLFPERDFPGNTGKFLGKKEWAGEKIF